MVSLRTQWSHEEKTTKSTTRYLTEPTVHVALKNGETDKATLQMTFPPYYLPDPLLGSLAVYQSIGYAHTQKNSRND